MGCEGREGCSAGKEGQGRGRERKREIGKREDDLCFGLLLGPE